MENTRRRKSSSGDAFSFPSTPTQDDDHYQDSSFEFGCISPDSPSSDPFKDSPADHLFFNGRLLPHAFPFQPGNGGFAVADDNNSRCFASRNSSISSKDSLTTSRSNSTNSRSGSSSSSARTSYSADTNYYSDRKLIVCGGRPTVGNKRASGQQVYGCSNRWQFITPAPSSTPRKMEELRSSGKKQDQNQRNKVVVRYQLGRRLFRWFVSACKECHAIEPSRKDKVVQPNVK